MLKSSILLFSISLFTINANSSAIINNDNLDNLSLKELMNIEIQSVSKYKQNITNAPGQAFVVTKEQIKERGYFDLSDVLKDLPGIDIVDNVRGFGEFYTIRGIEGNDRFLVLINGQKLNPVSGTFLSVGNSISIRFAERIEIIYGPSSVIYGADAFSAIINIITEKKGDNINIYTGYGNQNTLDIGTSFKKTFSNGLTIDFNGRIFNSKGLNLKGKDPIFSVIDDYVPPLRKEFEQPIYDHNIHLNLIYKKFKVSWFRQRFDEGNAFGQHPKSNIYNEENKWKLTSDIFSLNYKNETNAGIFTGNIAFISHIQDRDTQFYKTREVYKFDNVFSQYLTGEDKTIRFNINYFKSFNKYADIISGIEIETTESIPPYANDQVLGKSVKFEGINAEIISDALTISESRYAFFLQLTGKFKNLFNIIGGIRYDYLSRYGGTINPRLGIVSKFFKNTNLKILFGTAFQPPSLFLQYEQWGGATAVMRSTEEVKNEIAGWKLRNQRIKTIDFSLEHNFSDNFKITISTYFHYLKNLIERRIYTDYAYNKYFSDENNSVYSLGFRNENVGRQYIKGLNVGIYSKFHNFIPYIHYSYTDGKANTANGDNPIPRIAKNKLFFGFTLKNFLGIFTFSPNVRIIGKINNRNKTVFPDGKQPGYTEVNLSVFTKKLVGNTRLFIKIENLLNKKIRHGGIFDQTIHLPTVLQPGILFKIGFEYGLNE